MSLSDTILPLNWPRPSGYSHGVMAQGRTLFIAGQIGREESQTHAPLKKGFAAQFDQALANVLEVLAAAGGKPEHLARMTLFLTDRGEYLRARKEISQSWKKRMGNHYPTMTAVVVHQLLEEDALVEMEATAAF